MAPRHWLLAIGNFLLTLSLPGCTIGGAGRSGITEIHLFAAPTVLNLDEKPGPDAIGVRLYASGAAAARGLPVQQGTLELLMFDGSVSEADVRTAVVRKTWTFTPTKLRPFAADSSLGVGYQLTLSWEESPPQETKITVVARYRNPAGRELYSAPNTILVTTR